MPPSLEIVVRGSDRRFALSDGATLTVGRSPECDIRLEDPGVSRRHCTLSLDAGAIVVCDLGSANGTSVNGQPPGMTLRAVPGDTIRIGTTALADVCEAGAPARQRAVLADDESGIRPVVTRRIEPRRADWLTATEQSGSAVDVTLLHAAQRHLATLHAVSESLAAARDVKTLSRAALDAILDVTSADRAALVLRRRDPGTGAAEVAAARWQQESASSTPFTVSRTLVSDVMERGVSIFANDASRDARFAHGLSVIQQQVRSVMCVPLRTTDDVLGALYVDSQSGAGRFTDIDLELLAAIGNQAGVALHRVRLLGQVERLLIDTIRAIAATFAHAINSTHATAPRRTTAASVVSPVRSSRIDTTRTVHAACVAGSRSAVAAPIARISAFAWAIDTSRRRRPMTPSDRSSRAHDAPSEPMGIQTSANSGKRNPAGITPTMA